ncbi:YbgC/FadM family acyl-CoA thioesterase [Sulfitobacter sp. M57]|uniref:YbgC/FadM family acyl-CoA thioesterase n=1 Tax=unclassified Sulfitobacter TaxID=196795 RepID=UPI0023E0C03C|nr:MULTISPECIES: YbgC/FadM family acyl-CoA thioesterase [unclassified Sulfitobacter]MDF3412949.1 YbgC/FadM family acyl-CoA thioesterase [Sulfitobacter sp. KE5]MDF3421767.1 YbgC/FadM family acyl-CoA thioesterase [Sulfitobacter sp. KE43]MDF3431498.1 YbgC/FadM family acyl-CoA thioesterase [Sulfitobacter sp. KE42]MDF3457139.1 YbgC/FadM family acyl-CoA thioesterase [Sulfitobacter sp. S74]MDF3461042.1 YbgC/FadM family acyl-CoA thioesterase [Sulfitobacter sp. Ks18]
MSHSFPVRIFYEDTDMAGIVYYANYLKYIERARSDIAEQLGLDQKGMREEDIVFVITRVEADYLGSGRFGDRLEVRTTHHAKGAVRWMFDQEVLRGDEVIFRAKVTAVCMTTAGKPIRLPAKLRSVLPPQAD